MSIQLLCFWIFHKDCVKGCYYMYVLFQCFLPVLAARRASEGELDDDSVGKSTILPFLYYPMIPHSLAPNIPTPLSLPPYTAFYSYMYVQCLSKSPLLISFLSPLPPPHPPSLPSTHPSNIPHLHTNPPTHPSIHPSIHPSPSILPYIHPPTNLITPPTCIHVMCRV